MFFLAQQKTVIAKSPKIGSGDFFYGGPGPVYPPRPENMKPSIGMIIATQYEWENAKLMATSYHQPVYSSTVDILTADSLASCRCNPRGVVAWSGGFAWLSPTMGAMGPEEKTHGVA